ncbi:MAG: aminodeoxychorismate/anthranilate synthase component II [Candidatus Obscuribacterales bacterium]|nr:aminodeoxychorismate/anthranilate synthase component II [Candidatus Obscuribacterales bacterium]
MTILVIDNYDSFSFNLVQALRVVSDQPVIVRRNDKITLPEIRELSPVGIVISPGPGHPANKRDFGINSEVIANQMQLACPILGICLGHQGIVQTFGGSIIQAAVIKHGKTSLIEVTGTSTLFEGCERSFAAMRYHSLAAAEENLPECLTVIGRDASDNSIMAIEHKSSPIFGLQFHPESIGTPCGMTILRNFVSISRDFTKKSSTVITSNNSLNRILNAKTSKVRMSIHAQF